MTDNFDMKLTKKLTKRYRKETKCEKGKILDEYCKITGVKRNTAVQRLQRKLILPSFLGLKKRKYMRRGPKRRYVSIHKAILKKCWKLSGRLCAERLTPMIGVYLHELKKSGELKGYQEYDSNLVRDISVSSVRRMIISYPEYKKSTRIRPKGKTALFAHIPTNARFGQEVVDPGYYEVDFVCHTGGTTSGRYAITGVYIDVYTQWIMRRAGWGKNLKSMKHIHSHVGSCIYHPIHAYHPDNDRTILSLLFSRLTDNTPTSSFELSRSRPYQKNDNAHVEQKNGDKVRGLVGYHRYDTLLQVQLFNELYRIADLFDNFFIPSSKLIKKLVDEKGRVKKRIHDKAQTPYQRLMKNKRISPMVKGRLKKLYESLNMVELRCQIEAMLKHINHTIG